MTMPVSHRTSTRGVGGFVSPVNFQDLWIGDSGASSHMMGSEEHVFNKKLTTGSVRTANGAHMKMLCDENQN